MRYYSLIALFMGLFYNLNCQQNDWASKFSDAIIDRYQPTIDEMTHKGWDHSNSIILHGMEKVYERTLNPTYHNYIKSFVDSLIDEEGNIIGLKPELDRVHPGVLCLFLFEKTGDAKYKKGAETIRNYLLDTSYTSVAKKGWEGLKQYIVDYKDGKPQITSFNPGIGMKDNVAAYIAVRPVNSPSELEKQHPHGYCAVLMAGSVMEK